MKCKTLFTWEAEKFLKAFNLLYSNREKVHLWKLCMYIRVYMYITYLWLCAWGTLLGFFFSHFMPFKIISLNLSQPVWLGGQPGVHDTLNLVKGLLQLDKHHVCTKVEKFGELGCNLSKVWTCHFWGDLQVGTHNHLTMGSGGMLRVGVVVGHSWVTIKVHMYSVSFVWF